MISLTVAAQSTLETLSTGAFMPQSVLNSDSVKVLATFVALNTLMYATLAVVKMAPKVRISPWFAGSNRRAQSRSIYPDPEESER